MKSNAKADRVDELKKKNGKCAATAHHEAA